MTPYVCAWQFMMMSPLTFKEIFAATIEVCAVYYLPIIAFFVYDEFIVYFMCIYVIASFSRTFVR